MNEHGVQNLNRQEELSNCNFIKTVLMVLVVFYHSILFWNGSWFTEDPIETSVILNILAAWLNSFHIYGFTLVSGYLFGYLKLEKGKYVSLVRLLRTRHSGLCYPMRSLRWYG